MTYEEFEKQVRTLYPNAEIIEQREGCSGKSELVIFTGLTYTGKNKVETI